MIRARLIALCLALLCPAAFAGGGLDVTFIAHSGFVFQGDGRTVLADALVEATQWPHKAPSAALLAKMEHGEAPFDRVDLTFISHAHRDHFAPMAVERFMLAHRKTVLLTTPEVRDALAKECPTFAEFKSRVVAPDLAMNGHKTLKLGGVTIDLKSFQHLGSAERDNIVYAAAFTLGGRKVLFAPAVSGSDPAQLEGYRERALDVVFLSYEAVADRTSATTVVPSDGAMAAVRKRIAARTVVLDHIQPPVAKAVEEALPALRQGLGNVVIFHDAMESRRF